jgi:hypothetical protein
MQIRSNVKEAARAQPLSHCASIYPRSKKWIPSGTTEGKAKEEAMYRKRSSMDSFANRFGVPPHRSR